MYCEQYYLLHFIINYLPLRLKESGVFARNFTKVQKDSIYVMYIFFSGVVFSRAYINESILVLCLRRTISKGRHLTRTAKTHKTSAAILVENYQKFTQCGQ